MALFKILKGSGNLPTAKTEGWAYVKKINNDAAEFYVDYDANTRLQVGKQYNIVSATEDGIVPKFDAVAGRIDSNSSDWVLTNNNGSLGWYRLPTNAFKNDNTNTTYTLSGAASGDTWVTTLTGSDSATTTSTVPAASTTAAGLMTSAMVAKLNSIAEGATANKGDITQVTAGDGLTGGATSGNATLSANLGAGLVFDTNKKIAANTSYTSANKNYAVKTDSSGALYVNVPWSDTDTHHVTRIYTGASGATAHATSPVSNPYITVTDNNVYRTQVQLKGDGATSISADDGVITISSTNTTYSAFKGASASENGGTGLVPAPLKGQEGYYLRGDGVWFNLTGMDESVQNTFGALQKAWKEADSSLKDTLTTLINGKAQTNHASSGTSYGISTASLYGHAMASSTTPKASAATAVVGSETAKFARGDHVHPLTVSNAWTAGTTAGPKIATTVNSVTGAAVAIPTASASASGAVVVGDQTFGGIKRFSEVDIDATYHLGSFYNYGNGCLIDIGPAKASTMVAIHITGNSYTSSDVPINSLYQVYDYGSGTTMNYSGISIGQDLGDMKVYRYNNRLYAHVVQKTSYSTLNITLYTNKAGLTPTVTNAVAQASGYTDLVTITPSRPPLAASGVTAGTYGLDGTATPAFGGSFIVPKVTVDAYGRITVANEYNVTIPNSTASQTAAGLMSAADKKKLDGIATGANKITVDSALSTTSTNPVQNKIVTTAINGKADLSEGAIFIQGSGTTDSTAKTSTWLGTSSKITAYYDGLTIRYKIGVAGQSTTTLNINNLGAKTVYRFSDSKLTTHFPVNSIIHLIYHADLNGGCWMCSDYDANTNTQQRLYPTTSNVEYPITTRYNTTSGSSYYAEYGRYSTDVTLNPSTNTITASHFKGLATKATADASGNVITDTYATKAQAITGLSISGKVITYTKGDGTTGTITTQDNNTTYTAGTGLSLSGTTFNHSNSITAGSVGSAQSPSHGGTFAIPKITYDAQGHITGATTVNITLPGDNNTDTQVKQTVTTSNAAYPLLLAPSGQTATTTTTSYFDSGVTLNPSTNTIAANISGNATTASSLTSITESDKASSSETWRRLWMSYSNNTTGRPAYDDRFAIQTSTGTLKAPIFSGALSGNASTATKLATARSLQTNLASTTAASFDGSADASIGVTGILPVANGGTGNSALTANRLAWTASATKITAGYHYANNSKVAINSTAAPSQNFYVNGSSKLDGPSFINNTNFYYFKWSSQKSRPIGWYRLCKLGAGVDGYCSCIMHIAGAYNSGAPTVGTFAISLMHQTPRIVQLGGTVGTISQIRVTGASGSYYLEVYQNYDYVPSATTQGNYYFNFYGNVSVSEIQDPTAVSTAAAGTYTNTITVQSIKNDMTFTIKDADSSNAGTSSTFDRSANMVLKLPATIKATLNGNAATATKSGDGSFYLYPQNSNELNFGGSNSSTTIYMGYRATDSRPIPAKFVFGGASGSADLQVKTIYLGSGTTSYISSSQYTGNAATATKATNDANGNNIASTYLPLSGGIMTGSITMNANTQITNSDTGSSWILGRNHAAVRMTASTSASSFSPVVSSKTQLGSWDLGPCHPYENFYFSYATDTNFNANTNTTMTAIYFEKEGNIRANKVYGAVWNDYAEYRQTNISEPGRVVIENNDDTLSLATERLMPGANIISDTFGFAIGETKNAKTPLAVSGRVLAYTWEPRETFQAGDAVCSGPKGTVSKMTREEVMMYPERIIGTVSSVPTYETWGPNEIQVNGRIWIKVK